MASGKSFLSIHGDKVFLGAAIAALLVSGASAFLGMSSGEPDVTGASGGKPVQIPGVEDLKSEFDRLGQPYDSGQTNLLQLVSPVRVACTNCLALITWGAETCWRCSKPQPKLGAKTDSDGDGVPDIMEIANGMDPNRDDLGEDLDKDGFTNGEEITGATKPNDPAAHPPLVSKLRVRAITDRPIKFLLKEITKAGNTVILQVSIAGTDRIAKPGDTVNGWLLKSFDDASKTLEITRGSESFKLPRGAVVEKNRRVAALMSLMDEKWSAGAVPGQTVKLFEVEHEVLEIQEAAVILKPVGQDGKLVIGLVTPREVQALKNPRAGSGATSSNPDGF